MLRKLMKHEFRATGRVMVPLFGIILLLAIGANLSTRVLLESNTFIPNLLGGLLLTAFGTGLFALFIGAIVLMVNRFKSNLMGDEGYVMFTLPVSSHQLIWSKILVSTVWFVATAFVEFLAVLICVFDLDVLRSLFSSQFFVELAQAWQMAVDQFGFNLPLMIAEGLVLCLLGCAVACLQFYAAISVGYGFVKHKSAWSVLFFVVGQFVLQFLFGLLINVLDETSFYYWIYNLNGMPAFHAVMGAVLAILLAVGAVYYVITAVMLRRRLNLE